MDHHIFISFSHKNSTYLTELVSALEAVAAIRDKVWYDRKRIDIGDQFHPEIQQALAESQLAILLVSNDFLTSPYITQYELPFLLRQAECKTLKLGILHVGTVAKAALTISVEIDGQPRVVNLADTLGINSPAEPLDKMSPGDRNVLYARAADWAVRQLTPTPPPTWEPTGPRHELAIFVQARRDHWEHQFFLPAQPSAIKPKLDCPEPAMVVGHDLDGEMLFQLLFGDDPTTVGQLLALAFGADRPADPTHAPLRVRLITDEERFQVLPWGRIAYRGRPLAQAGWTVEFHGKNEPGFPEYSRHLCYFPGRVVLAGSGKANEVRISTTCNVFSSATGRKILTRCWRPTRRRCAPPCKPARPAWCITMDRPRGRARYCKIGRMVSVCPGRISPSGSSNPGRSRRCFST